MLHLKYEPKTLVDMKFNKNIIKVLKQHINKHLCVLSGLEGSGKTTALNVLQCELSHEFNYARSLK